ncbi:MAG: hypothetical protein EBY29_16385 [Planctomycetes bacterium]|nr:hypothetical protein [Planctomycetota bacterium]
MNAVVHPSLLGIIILGGLVGLIFLVIILCINASLFRRLTGRSLEMKKKAKNPVATTGWTEAGRRVSTPSAEDIESQFGDSGKEPPTEDRQ